jgi:hypothetical protein
MVHPGLQTGDGVQGLLTFGLNDRLPAINSFQLYLATDQEKFQAIAESALDYALPCAVRPALSAAGKKHKLVIG